VSKIKCIPIPYLSPKAIARFYSKVGPERPDGCRDWNGSFDGQSYGRFKARPHPMPIRAHRIAYFLHYGVDPYPLRICHTCDRPSCVEPSHLWAGTDADNVADKVKKGRCPRGDNHPFRIHPERIPHGEAHCNAKLTQEDVDNIRVLYRCIGYTQYEIADMYELSQSYVGRIVRNQAWKNHSSTSGNG
jgi:hypothetical protein